MFLKAASNLAAISFVASLIFGIFDLMQLSGFSPLSMRIAQFSMAALIIIVTNCLYPSNDGFKRSRPMFSSTDSFQTPNWKIYWSMMVSWTPATFFTNGWNRLVKAFLKSNTLVVHWSRWAKRCVIKCDSAFVIFVSKQSTNAFAWSLKYLPSLWAEADVDLTIMTANKKIETNFIFLNCFGWLGWQIWMNWEFLKRLPGKFWGISVKNIKNIENNIWKEVLFSRLRVFFKNNREKTFFACSVDTKNFHRRKFDQMVQKMFLMIRMLYPKKVCQFSQVMVKAKSLLKLQLLKRFCSWETRLPLISSKFRCFILNSKHLNYATNVQHCGIKKSFRWIPKDIVSCWLLLHIFWAADDFEGRIDVGI